MNTKVGEFDPEENRFLVELKRQWKAGKYDQDSESVCSVAEILMDIQGEGLNCLICNSSEHPGIECPERLV